MKGINPSSLSGVESEVPVWRAVLHKNDFLFFSPLHVRGALILGTFIDSASGAHYRLMKHSHRRKEPKDKTALNLQWQPFINQARA